MTFRDLLRDTLRTLSAHKLRTALTMFGIAWGIVSITLMVAAGEGLRVGQAKVSEQFAKEDPYIRRRLKAEVASNLYGLVARYRVDSEGDGQLQKALDLMPQARKLLAANPADAKKKI